MRVAPALMLALAFAGCDEPRSVRVPETTNSTCPLDGKILRTNERMVSFMVRPSHVQPTPIVIVIPQYCDEHKDQVVTLRTVTVRACGPCDEQLPKLDKTTKVKRSALPAGATAQDAEHTSFESFETKTDAAHCTSKPCKCYAKHPDWETRACDAVLKQKVYIGMTAEQAKASWGAPDHVNRTTTAYGRSEQWVYEGGSYLYFDDGILKTIQN